MLQQQVRCRLDHTCRMEARVATSKRFVLARAPLASLPMLMYTVFDADVPRRSAALRRLMKMLDAANGCWGLEAMRCPIKAAVVRRSLTRVHVCLSHALRNNLVKQACGHAHVFKIDQHHK